MLCAEADEGSDGSGHRLLVFAQMKGMLDLVERDVLLPSGVSFLRLDGSMEPNSRCATAGTSELGCRVLPDARGKPKGLTLILLLQ